MGLIWASFVFVLEIWLFFSGGLSVRFWCRSLLFALGRGSLSLCALGGGFLGYLKRWVHVLVLSVGEDRKGVDGRVGFEAYMDFVSGGFV